jgi:hypothetical protein
MAFHYFFLGGGGILNIPFRRCVEANFCQPFGRLETYFPSHLLQTQGYTVSETILSQYQFTCFETCSLMCWISTINICIHIGWLHFSLISFEKFGNSECNGASKLKYVVMLLNTYSNSYRRFGENASIFRVQLCNKSNYVTYQKTWIVINTAGRTSKLTEQNVQVKQYGDTYSFGPHRKRQA